jgi:RNA polymerase sigma-70 factor (ECF subfamily)
VGQDDHSDRELVGRCVAGDRSARRELAARLLDAIQREVAIVLRRRASEQHRDARQDVLDLVQDVLVCLFERDAQELRRWDPARGRSLGSFVRLVARRRIARVLGQRRGNPWLDVTTDGDTDPTDDTVEQRLEQRADLDAVLDLLYASMDTRDAELFEMLFIEELDADEVGRRMAMTPGAVNAWRYRMRKLARAAERRIVVGRDAASTSKVISIMKEVGGGR